MKLGFGISALMLFCASAQADWYMALHDYQNKKYQSAHTEFQRLFTMGNSNAAYNLGVMAYNGEGVPRDKIEAISYLNIARDLGRKDAQALLAKIQSSLNAE